MTLDQLKIFLAVAEAQHVTRAARSLNMTQSAVSAAIHALEDQHGVRLFDRVGRGIVLTEEGRAFIATARAVCGTAEAAKRVLDDLSGTPRGHLRIEASQTIATYVLPPLLVRLQADWPALSLAMEAGNTASVARAVAEGRADLGFVEGEVHEDGLSQRVFARDEMVLVMSPGHPMQGKAGFTTADYRAMRWILREPGSGTRSEFEAHLRDMGLGVADLEVALELGSNEAVLSSLGAGECVAMVSQRVVAERAAASVLRRPVDWARRPERAFSVLTHPARHRTRAAAALLDLL